MQNGRSLFAINKGKRESVTQSSSITIQTLCGRLVAEASRVMEIELVLDAKMAEDLVILSSLLNIFFLMASDSAIASITKSAPLKSSNLVVQCMRLGASVRTA